MNKKISYSYDLKYKTIYHAYFDYFIVAIDKANTGIKDMVTNHKS